MKKNLFAILTIALSFNTFAQVEETPTSTPTKSFQQEAGLTFANFNSFGLTYRFGTAKSMWRINTLLLNGSSTKSEFDQNNTTQSDKSSFGTNLKLGKEFRKKINDNFEFRYGLDASVGFDRSHSVNNNPTNNPIINPTNNFTSDRKTLSAGLNFVLGFNYVFSNNLVFGAEILPGISYSSSKNTSSTDNGGITNDSKTKSNAINYGLSNSGAMLSLVYRF